MARIITRIGGFHNAGHVETASDACSKKFSKRYFFSLNYRPRSALGCG
jgi:hypothetical protein